MKIALFAILFSSSVFSLSISEVEASINEASKSFETQKEERNITKLLEISKTLYENNEKIKQLKASTLPKLELLFDGEKNSNFKTGDTLHIKAITRHKLSQMYEKSLLEFQIFEENLLLGAKKVELFQSNTTHEEKLSFQILKPSNAYKICAVFTEDSSFQECKIFSASGENVEEKKEELKQEVKAPPKPQPIPMPKIEPKPKQVEKTIKPQIGDTKDETFNDRGVVFHYKVRFDGSYWIKTGHFKAYYDYTKTSSDEWHDEIAIKGALAQEGEFKDDKFHGKITSFYGNGQIKSIEYFDKGNIIQNKMSYFYADGKTKEIRKVVDGHIIQASWRKDGEIQKLHESTNNGFINLTEEGYKISSKNLKNQPICVAEFSNNHISKITCYHEDGSVLGFKSFINNQINVAFYPKGSTSCTNRLNHQGNINRCADDIELQFMKKHDEFVKSLTLMKSGGYIKHLIFSHLATSIGEGIYYAVYNSILDKKLFMHSNPTQKCSFLSDSIKRQFVEFDKRVQNKPSLFLRAKDNSFDANKKMIMQEFAKMYYPHQKQNNDCHNEVVNFYKQMGYL